MTSWFVPGRLEVFGKHTDYAGGHSIVAAVDRGIRVTLDEGDLPDGGISAQTTALPDRVEVGAGAASTLPAGHWGHYVQ
ncbi:UNVERIFIED_CONTAM: galactokinase family protein, partial [Bacillus sp. ATCC 13368]